MKKYLFLLAIPLLIAARYQVSCDMTFIDSEQAQVVYDCIRDCNSLAYNANIPGDPDYLLPSDPNGCLRVQCKHRFLDKSSQDFLYDYLNLKKEYVTPGTSGFLEKHHCFGDSPSLPCRDQIMDSWGNAQ